MSDNLRPEDRRKTMQAVKAKNTGLERRLFAMLAGMGLKGWTRNATDVHGKPDVVFRPQLAIFIDGCFWHGCPLCKRKLPETNRQYWEHKISRNIELARSTDRTLTNDRWKVLRIWEHEMRDETAREDIRHRILSARGEKVRRNGRKPSKA